MGVRARGAVIDDNEAQHDGPPPGNSFLIKSRHDFHRRLLLKRLPVQNGYSLNRYLVIVARNGSHPSNRSGRVLFRAVSSTARERDPAPQRKRADKSEIEEIDRKPGREGRRVKAEMIVKNAGKPAARRHAPAAAQ